MGHPKRRNTRWSQRRLLHSVTLHAFTDASHAVFPWSSAAGIAPPQHSASSAPSSMHGDWSAWLLFLLVKSPDSFYYSHLCYYEICPACMHSALSPCDYCTRMFSAFDACSFCSALDFHCTYIRLVKHVCFASLYIDFDYCLSPTRT